MMKNFTLTNYEMLIISEIIKRDIQKATDSDAKYEALSNLVDLQNKYAEEYKMIFNRVQKEIQQETKVIEKDNKSNPVSGSFVQKGDVTKTTNNLPAPIATGGHTATTSSSVATANNVNEGRHIGRSDQWSPARQPRSLLTTRSVAGEIDYQAQDESVKETFRTDYTSTTDEQTMSQHRERFLEGYTPTSLTESFNRKGTKKLNLHNSLTLRKPFWISTEAEFNYAKRDGSFNSAFDEWGDSLIVSQRTVGMSQGTVWSGYVAVQGAIPIGKKENKNHIDFFAKVEHSNDEMEQARRYEQTTEAARQTVPPSRQTTHNANDLFNRSTGGSAHVGYAKEVAKDFYINVTDFFGIRSQHNHDYLYHPDSLLLPSQIKALTAITDPKNSYDSHDFDWSNNLIIMFMKKKYYTHPQFHIKVDYAPWQLYVRLPVQHERLHYQRGVLDTLARQTAFLPNFTFSYRNVWKGGRRDFLFKTNFNQERNMLLDRVSFRDDSQPLVVKLGNPDLKGKAYTDFSADYYDRTGPRNGMYHLSASFNYRHRDVAQSVSNNPPPTHVMQEDTEHE